MRGSIRPRGKSWELKFDLAPGENGQRRIAYVTFKGDKKAAEKELRKRIAAVDEGTHIDPSKETLGAYLTYWLENVAPLNASPITLQGYSSKIRSQVLPYLGHIKLQKLDVSAIVAWQTKLVSAGKLSRRTIRHAHATLSLALAFAVMTKRVQTNVAVVAGPPKVEDKEVAIWDKEEVTAALMKLEGLPIYPIALLAFSTGARRGELCALTWADLDLDAATMEIRRSLEQTKGNLRVKAPKTRSGIRTVALPATVIGVLRKHKLEAMEHRLACGLGGLPDDAPVFGDIEGNWPSPVSVSNNWRNAVSNHALPKITFHALRHCHAAVLIASGLDIMAVSRQLGHTKPGFTLNRYGHLYGNRNEAAAAAIDAVFS
ncbi:MAG: tyrosine-type recombinase/integrase [Alphaproteobacteria bacterium]|nr:tyrosine-type recombinase/integrase [Alphaproteobacteria bacterium]MCZ6496884.1 tyrosine-type recombinase/integrase [Alphaproteobacteria bacterium]MCZ6608567.1 tyrosine-type recombinase/integrase [Alphaproteobacteria bacterium]MCZ6742519.1 tyrosine-type recombinase/integrase [Alphaproteobacteria bacterium]